MSSGQKFFLSIVGIVIAGTVMILNIMFIGKGPSRIEVNTAEPQNRFSVSAEGKVSMKPDVALVNFGVMTERGTVAQATKENTQKMNEVIASVKRGGVEDKDIRTTMYQLNPAYEYPPNLRPYIRGYSLNQQIEVKIRDFDKVGEIIEGATAAGANEVGSLQFTIDEPENLKADARKAAIEKARAKAESIADESGLRLGRLMNVSEGSFVPPPMPMYARAEALSFAAEKSMAPDIQAGEQEVVVSVTLMYEVE